MLWNELAAALCMVLVIEGILPFLSPRRWRSVAEMAVRVDDLTVRMLGFTSMMIGTTLLYFVR
ncbi:MAG TPA: DUF2065 domain-containing protein [Pseudomonadales bacterium]|jgi:uncharacterized protein YjeT (DUF2065 family)|nr:DUF2065 domain-containing protein [Pseudomonadales bacterium]